MPKVSVVIPMYNASLTIERALRSVVEQSFGDYEVFIIDDGSKEHSVAVVKAFVAANNLGSKFHILRQSNSGPSVARNRGVAEAQGEYVAFLDSDDEWLPEKLAIQVAAMEQEPSWVLLGTLLANQSCGQDEILSVGLKGLLFRNSFITSSAMVRTQTLRKHGLAFNTAQKYSEDYRLWLDLCSVGKCAVIQKELVIYDGGVPKTSGLSTRLRAMEAGELSNFHYLLRQGKINSFLWAAACCFSLLKYTKRLLKGQEYH